MAPVRNAYIHLNFTRIATEPRIQDLQPIVDNSNPLFVREGNPGLTPEIRNDMSIYFSRSYPASGVRFSLNGRYTIFSNKITHEEMVDDNLITTYRPINVDRGQEGNYWASLNLPIVRNKFTSRLSLSGNLSNLPAYVNGLENNTRILSVNPYILLNITPSENTAIYITGRLRNSRTTYDISTSQNQKIRNQQLGIEFNTKLIAGLYFNYNFDYNRYTNDRFEADETIPVLNISVYKQFLKGNKGEIRFSVYDAFNKNVSFSQSAYGNGVNQTFTNALGRYGMLSFIYNIKGLKAGVQKRRHG